MKKKAWSGRFNLAMDEMVEDFNSSVHFDKRLYKQDIQGSIAWAKALLKAGMLKQVEYSEIISALSKIEKEIKAGKIEFKKEHEDVHMNIENLLTRRIGEAGKKIHTGRSRNDQVVTDVRMYLKEEIVLITQLVLQFQKTIIHLADKHIDSVMPGYTHLQKAQPILFSHYLMAYYEMFKRDMERLEECFERVDVLPLGSAALAGTSYDLNRKLLARELDFGDISRNSIDAVSDRDFVIEFISNCSIIMMHLSRLSEEIVIWTTSEFKYLELSDAYATGSSIMPQKKNPDVAELTRGKSGRVYGHLMAILTVMKGLPLAYNRDMQEDKEQLFDSIDTVKACLKIMNNLIKTMKVNESKMLSATEKGCLTATDLADYLVQKGLPFRMAHEVTGRIVRFCVDTDKDIYQMSRRDFQNYCDKIEEDVHDYITISHSLDSRNVVGGTAKKQVKNAIDEAKKELQECMKKRW